MTDYPADILSQAQSIVSAISSRMEASSTLGDAATEVIAEALMAERTACAEIVSHFDLVDLRCDLSLKQAQAIATRDEIMALAIIRRSPESSLAIRSGEQP